MCLWSSSLPLPSCAALGKFLDLPKCQFHHQANTVSQSLGGSLGPRVLSLLVGTLVLVVSVQDDHDGPFLFIPSKCRGSSTAHCPEQGLAGLRGHWLVLRDSEVWLLPPVPPSSAGLQLSS